MCGHSPRRAALTFMQFYPADMVPVPRYVAFPDGRARTRSGRAEGPVADRSCHTNRLFWRFLGCGRARLMAFAVGRRWLRLGGGVCQPVVLEGFPDAPCGGGADALVDGKCLLQVRGGLAGAAIVSAGLAESFQGAGFPPGRPE